MLKGKEGEDKGRGGERRGEKGKPSQDMKTKLT